MSRYFSKMNYIVTDEYFLPNESSPQRDIFKNQKVKYIDKDSTISVLSGFPVFMFDYFGFTKFSKIIG